MRIDQVIIWVGMLVCSATVQAGLISESDVARQADTVFRQMKRQIPISNNARARQVVECVSWGIINQLDEPYRRLNWEIVLFEQASVNAFAMPGGKIGVHTGIFSVAHNQHQLAAVIGHEIAHVTLQHATKRANRKALTSGAVAILSSVIGDGGLTTQVASSALGIGAELGLNRPYDRDQESEADVVGLHYIARAGFDPREALELWKSMSDVQQTAPPEFISTHPSDETRMDGLIGVLTESLIEAERARQAGVAVDCGSK
jgi:predicted Zn-dependent protease